MVIDEFCFVSTTIYGKWLEPTEPLHHAEGWPSLVSRILTTGFSCSRWAKLHYVITCLVHLQAMTQQTRPDIASSLSVSGWGRPRICATVDSKITVVGKKRTKGSIWIKRNQNWHASAKTLHRGRLHGDSLQDAQEKAAWRQLAPDQQNRLLQLNS